MKKLFPFVVEGMIMLSVILITVFGLLMNELIVITVKPHLLSFTAIIVCVVTLLYYSRTIWLGIKASIDLLFSTKRVVTAKVIKMYPCQASEFSEKWRRGGFRQTDTRFFIIVKSHEKVIVLISRDYIENIENKSMTIQYGRFSHVVLSVITT